MLADLRRLGQILRRAGPLAWSARAGRGPEPATVRRTLEELGSTFIKLGQFLSLRVDLLPPEYCGEFLKLLDRVPPFSFAEVERVLEEDLGAPWARLFRAFDREPCASASFGQVHRAVLPSGEVVAVKVQRPGLRPRLASDIRLLRALVRLLQPTGALGAIEFLPMIDEFAAWTADELDYRREAHFADRLRAAASGDQDIRIPRIHWDLTRERVLTMAYLEGLSLADIVEEIWLAGEKAPEVRQRYRDLGHDLPFVAHRLVRHLLDEVFRWNFFHADPHPANILLMPRTQIGYVDFGIMGSLSDYYRENMLETTRALAARDPEAIFRCVQGIVTPTRETNLPAFERELKENIQRWVEAQARPDAPFEERSTSRLSFANFTTFRRHRVKTPADVIRFYRAIWTIDAICQQIHPAADPATEMASFLDAKVVAEFRQLLTPEGLLAATGTLVEVYRRLPRLLQLLRPDRAPGNSGNSLFVEVGRPLGQILVLGFILVGLLLTLDATAGGTVLGLSPATWKLGALVVFLLVCRRVLRRA